LAVVRLHFFCQKTNKFISQERHDKALHTGAGGYEPSEADDLILQIISKQSPLITELACKREGEVMPTPARISKRGVSNKSPVAMSNDSNGVACAMPTPHLNGLNSAVCFTPTQHLNGSSSTVCVTPSLLAGPSGTLSVGVHLRGYVKNIFFQSIGSLLTSKTAASQRKHRARTFGARTRAIRADANGVLKPFKKRLYRIECFKRLLEVH
jgi:hypothetical protein